MNNSIDINKVVSVNGNKQFIDIQGRDKNLPVLLILHGGPGTPETAFVNHYNKKLSEYFIVVNWEQRGAGVSLIEQEPPSGTMTISQFVEDVKSVTDFLKNEFDKKKIYLLGHSWGSQLGMFAIKKYPNDYIAYIGTGQVSNTEKSESKVFQMVYEWAKKDKNLTAIKDLEGISAPPFTSYDYMDIDKLETHRRWATYYGGGPVKMIRMDQDKNIDPVVFLTNLINSYLPYEKYDMDLGKFYRGQSFLPDSFFLEVSEADPMKLVQKVEVPVYFLQGLDDAQTSHDTAKEYFQILDAPYKEFVTFEHSSHSPMFEEVDKFYQVIETILKRRTAE